MCQREDEFLADAQTMGAKSFAHKVHRWARLIDEDGPTTTERTQPCEA
jgi:hypothetical protein